VRSGCAGFSPLACPSRSGPFFSPATPFVFSGLCPCRSIRGLSDLPLAYGSLGGSFFGLFFKHGIFPFRLIQALGTFWSLPFSFSRIDGDFPGGTDPVYLFLSFLSLLLFFFTTPTWLGLRKVVLLFHSLWVTTGPLKTSELFAGSFSFSPFRGEFLGIAFFRFLTSFVEGSLADFFNFWEIKAAFPCSPSPPFSRELPGQISR